MLLGAGKDDRAITELCRQVPPHPSPGPALLVPASGPTLLVLEQFRTGMPRSFWGSLQRVSLPKADPCCRHGPIFLQKVPQLLCRAAVLAELLPSRWCHISLKHRQEKGQMSAKSLISHCPHHFISSLILVKAGTLLTSSAAV